MSESSLLLIFPHQLFENHPGLEGDVSRAALIEDSLFFGDRHHTERFHQQKLWLHRASMRRYESRLQEAGITVEYVEHEEGVDVLGDHLDQAQAAGVRSIIIADPHDDLLGRRIERHAKRLGLEVRVDETPMFLNPPAENRAYRAGKKRWFMADFYKHQRRRLDVLMDGDEPEGERWSFDEDNRKKVPKAMLSSLPDIPTIDPDRFELEAKAHVLEGYSSNPGSITELIYPTSHAGAAEWLATFLEDRLGRFGDYEDAIVRGENWLWHGILTPMLNIGLLTPEQVLRETLAYAGKNEVPINALEGFVRQVIGWREFMRASYEDLGVRMRTTNHWGHDRPMPSSFYDATTGIPPIDDAISRVLKTGYCHHIERLMVLGGFMFLCEIHPDAIYRWFMEMFVDSYDWVMVPNVYAMSQNADGGLITTKPYFSGSSYIRKMSNHPKGDWTEVWDGLYWRWIINHSDELARNPRWAMMCAAARKMAPEKRDAHLANAEAFLEAIRPNDG